MAKAGPNATATRSIKATDIAYRKLKVEAGRRGIRLIDLLEAITADWPDPDERPAPSGRRRRRASA